MPNVLHLKKKTLLRKMYDPTRRLTNQDGYENEARQINFPTTDNEQKVNKLNRALPSFRLSRDNKKTKSRCMASCLDRTTFYTEKTARQTRDAKKKTWKDMLRRTLQKRMVNAVVRLKTYLVAVVGEKKNAINGCAPRRGRLFLPGGRSNGYHQFFLRSKPKTAMLWILFTKSRKRKKKKKMHCTALQA